MVEYRSFFQGVPEKGHPSKIAKQNRYQSDQIISVSSIGNVFNSVSSKEIVKNRRIWRKNTILPKEYLKNEPANGTAHKEQDPQ